MYKLTETLLLPNGNTQVRMEYLEGRNSSFDTVEIIGDQTHLTEDELLALAKQEIMDRINPDNAIKRLKEEITKFKEDALDEITQAKLETEIAMAELAETLIGGM